MARSPSALISSVTAVWALCSSSALAAAPVHHFFVGNGDAPASVYSLAYDDQAASLAVVKNNTVADIHPFLTFSHDQKNLYSAGSGSRRFYSYTVHNATTLTYDTSLEPRDACANTTASHLLASPNWPYTVFGAHYPGPASCGSVLSISADDDGTLSSVSANYSYAADSAVYGLAFSPNAYFVYSADVDGQAVWTHYVNPNDGALMPGHRAPVARGGAPSEVLVHRMGRALFVLLRESNELLAWPLGSETAEPVGEGRRWSLLPDAADQNDYISTSLTLSSDGQYLLTTSSPKYYDQEGYLTLFSVDATSGAVLAKLATKPTALGADGHAAAAAPFAADLIALTYSPSGRVDIWRVLPGGDMSVVASTQVDDGGCCGKALWYD